jgi:hypothetical protein
MAQQYHLFADCALENGWTDTESQAFHLCAAAYVALSRSTGACWVHLCSWTGTRDLGGRRTRCILVCPVLVFEFSR